MAIALLNTLVTTAATDTESMIQRSVTSEENTQATITDSFSLNLTDEPSDNTSAQAQPEVSEISLTQQDESMVVINEEDDAIARQQWLNQQPIETAEWKPICTSDTNINQELLPTSEQTLDQQTAINCAEMPSDDDRTIQIPNTNITDDALLSSWSNRDFQETVLIPTQSFNTTPENQTLAATSNDKLNVTDEAVQNIDLQALNITTATTQSETVSLTIESTPKHSINKQHAADEPIVFNVTDSDTYQLIPINTAVIQPGVTTDSKVQELSIPTNSIALSASSIETQAPLQRRITINDFKTAEFIVAGSNNISATGNSFLTSSGLTGNTTTTSDLGQTMLNTLKQQVELQVTQQTKQATVRLDPPSLGQLQVTVTVTHDRLHVEIQASHDSLRQALEQTRDQLRQVLASERSGQIDVQISQHRDESHQQQSTNDETEIEVIKTASSDAAELPSLLSTEPENSWLNTMV